MTLILIFLTSLISVWAMGNRKLFERMMLRPYLVVHRWQWLRTISCGFVHADYVHLVVNMVVLFSFGQNLEQIFKGYAQAEVISNVYLSFGLLYFGSLWFSSLPDLVRHRNDVQYGSIGASGAVSAVIFASVFFNPWARIYLFGMVPLPGIVFGLLYVGYEQYLAMSRREGDNVNHYAHIAGAVFGFIYPVLVEPELWHQFVERLLHP